MNATRRLHDHIYSRKYSQTHFDVKKKSKVLYFFLSINDNDSSQKVVAVGEGATARRNKKWIDKNQLRAEKFFSLLYCY